MNYNDLPDLITVESNLDLWLFESQKLYEMAVKKFIKFKEAHINSEIIYDNAIAEQINRLKSDDERVTIIKEQAKSLCAKEYKEMMILDGKKERCSMWLKAMENRINMLKYLMKRKYFEMEQ